MLSGIKIQRLDELDLKTSGTFVQEYIQNPLLIGKLRNTFFLNSEPTEMIKSLFYDCRWSQIRYRYGTYSFN